MTTTSSHPRKFWRIVRRGFIGIALVAILVALASTVFLDSLARLLLTPSFSSAGIELQSMNGLRLRPESAHLDNVQFRFIDSQQSSHIENLTVHFNWRELLEGRIEQLHVANVTLALPDSAPNASTTSSPSNALPSMPDIRQQLDLLPVNSLAIDSLTIAPYIEAATLTLQHPAQAIVVNFSAQDTQLDLTLSWPDNVQNRDANTAFTGSITLGNSQGSALSSGFTLSDSSSHLRLESTVELQTEIMQRLLNQHELVTNHFTQVSGTFNFDFLIESSPSQEQAFQFNFSTPPSQGLDIRFTDDNPLALTHVEWLDTAGITVDGTIEWPNFSVALTASAPKGQMILSPTQISASTLAYSLSPLSLTCEASTACTGTLASTVQLDTFSMDEVGIDKLLAISTATATLNQDQTLFEFAQGSRIEAGSVRYADTTLLNANVLAQEPVQATLASNGDWRLTSDSIEFFVPELINADKSTYFTLAFQDLTGSVTGADELQLESQLHIRNIGSDWLPASLRKPETTLNLSASDNNIDIRGDIRLADRDILRFDAQWAVNENAGSLQISSPALAFGSGAQTLSELFFTPPFTGDLIGGSLQASAALDIEQDNELNWLINGPISLTATDLSGFYEDVGIINLNTHLQGSLIDGLYFKSTQNHSFSIERIDVGLPVEQIAFDYALDTENTLFSVDDFEATLFSGKVRANTLRYDWSAPRNQLELRIERLDLSRMLDLAAYDSVQATGFISGTLPLALTGSSPSIGRGELHVEAPGGAIHYSALGGAGSNAAIDFVNQALSNYQYDVMDTSVNYQPSGELDLGVRLQGLNPDMNNGQRINLNLNINDNIPALLQSLQSGRSIADALERAIQAQ